MFFGRIKRPIAGTVLVTFLSLVLQPLSVLAQDRPPSAASRRAAETGEEKFSRTLNEIHEILKEVAPQAAMPHMFPRKKGETELRAIGPNMKIEVEPAKPAAGVDVAAKVSQLRAKAKELASLEQHVRAGFDETARHIKEKNLPAEILARHEEALKTYEARAAEFKALVAAVERTADAGGAPLQTALTDLGTFMARYPNQKTHTPTDPNKLPLGTPKPEKREPYTTPEQFRTSGLFDDLYRARLAEELKVRPLRIAQVGSLSAIGLPTGNLPQLPGPADLAETEDAQLTPAVRAKAAELGNQPVAIYNWVRNNVEFVPNYGSIQGADMTLQTKRGNAFDTSNLLIALLRAANIPARYVYGTITVPADKVGNWVGGTALAQATQNLLWQGGIPNVGIGQSGTIGSIRMEHVWVEAYVDYIPSRGAVHRQGDTWVPMDASFKQYQLSPGFNLEAAVPFDGQAFADRVRAQATINAEQGWIQGTDRQLVQQAFDQYRAEVLQYINTQKPDATVKDIVGTKVIIHATSSILLGTLPYSVTAVGAKFRAVPDNLRWKFQYRLYASEFDRATDSPIIDHAISIPRLSGKRFTLSFRPATEADSTTINSFLPKPHPDGAPIEPSELPDSLPGYLIRLVPEVRIDGQLVASGPSMTMGGELIQGAGLYSPANGWQFAADNRPTVGELIATTVTAGTTSSPLLESYRARAFSIRDRVQAGDVEGMSGETLLGDAFHATGLTYFTSVDNQRRVLGDTAQIVSSLEPSFGNFGLALTAVFSFGVVRAVKQSGTQVDVDYLMLAAVSKSNDARKTRGFVLQVGQTASGLEHLVPETLFGGSENPSEGVSAVKGLLTASEAGQRIYNFTPASGTAGIAQLSISADVANELINAVHAGREVIVSATSVSISGWTGVGYVITDPATGAGAYKISGGTNGGFLRDLRKAIYILATGVALTNWFLDIRGGSFGPFLYFAQFATGMANLAVACADIDGDALRDLIIGYVLMNLLVILFLFLAVAAFGPVAALIIGQVSFYFQDMIMTNARRSRGCLY